jgi:putative NADH-flavin reductase
MNEPNRSRVAVLGAGGRAGRAIVREAARRGLPVVAVVRDPRRHADLATEDIESLKVTRSMQALLLRSSIRRSRPL